MGSFGNYKKSREDKQFRDKLNSVLYAATHIGYDEWWKNVGLPVMVECSSFANNNEILNEMWSRTHLLTERWGMGALGRKLGGAWDWATGKNKTDPRRVAQDAHGFRMPDGSMDDETPAPAPPPAAKKGKRDPRRVAQDAHGFGMPPGSDYDSDGREIPMAQPVPTPGEEAANTHSDQRIKAAYDTVKQRFQAHLDQFVQHIDTHATKQGDYILKRMGEEFYKQVGQSLQSDILPKMDQWSKELKLTRSKKKNPAYDEFRKKVQGNMGVDMGKDSLMTKHLGAAAADPSNKVNQAKLLKIGKMMGIDDEIMASPNAAANLASLHQQGMTDPNQIKKAMALMASQDKGSTPTQTNMGGPPSTPSRGRTRRSDWERAAREAGVPLNFGDNVENEGEQLLESLVTTYSVRPKFGLF